MDKATGRQSAQSYATDPTGLSKEHLYESDIAFSFFFHFSCLHNHLQKQNYTRQADNNQLEVR